MIIFINYINQSDEINFIIENNLKYIEYKYKSIGIFNFQTPFLKNIVNYLIVGGGGGGGSRHSGGGGAGCVIMANNIEIPPGNYSIIIGKGGNGGYGSENGIGENGDDSSFFGEIAKGGGGGGSYSNLKNGKSGGSGGGSLGGLGGISNKLNSLYGISYGNSGGNDIGQHQCSFFHGGGGGAGGPGENGSLQLNKSGDGGPGIKWIDNKFYAGGGGASTYQNGKAGNGGIGGGGGGNSYVSGEQCNIGGLPGNGTDGAQNGIIESIGLYCNGGNALNNTGSGGGGSSQNLPPNYSVCKGGKGGSGIIIIRILINENISLKKKINIQILFNFFTFIL